MGVTDAKTLVGKCVKIKVTETQKWHITGYITELEPELPTVPKDYFERLEKQREIEAIKLALNEK